MNKTQERIDLRSDTVSLPTKEMIAAIRETRLGDDVLGEDPTVNTLEKEAAEMLGKEAALLVPSGTFGNQAAIYTHTQKGDEIIAADPAHIVQYEVGAAAAIAGVQLRSIPSEDGCITAGMVREKIRQKPDIHFPETGLIVVQNPLGNGRVVPVETLSEIKQTAREFEIPVHMDGARIFNAATYLKTDVKNIAALADSVMFCLSKGLGAPIGSVLVGSEKFIDKARKTRKMMGGGMRQAGIIAAPGLYALRIMTKRLEEDHKNIRNLAKALNRYEIFEVDFSRIHTNILYLGFNAQNKNIGERFANILGEYGIYTYPPYGGKIRLVTHHNISSRNIEYFIDRLPEITKRLES